MIELLIWVLLGLGFGTLIKTLVNKANPKK